jgi:hypothetical protein
MTVLLIMYSFHHPVHVLFGSKYSPEYAALMHPKPDAGSKTTLQAHEAQQTKL